MSASKIWPVLTLNATVVSAIASSAWVQWLSSRNRIALALGPVGLYSTRSQVSPVRAWTATEGEPPSEQLAVGQCAKAASTIGAAAAASSPSSSAPAGLTAYEMHCCGQESGIPCSQQPVWGSRMHDGGGLFTAQVVVRQNANAARPGSVSARTTTIATASTPARSRRARSGSPGRSVDVSDGAALTASPTNR